MSKIPCELVQDLLPNYIEKLTGEKSTELIRAHLETCENCRKVYRTMAGEEDSEAKDTPPDDRQKAEKKEIDFLKKNRRRNRMIAAGSILGGLLLTAGILLAWIFLIGSNSDGTLIYCDVQVDGQHITAKGSVIDSILVVRKIRFREQDGVVTMTPVVVWASVFHPGGFREEYDAKGEIREVRMGNKVLWERKEPGKFSSRLSGEILKSYEEWDQKSEEEQMLSSTLPYYITKSFETWEEAEEYLGLPMENPFENAGEFEKMNYSGADVIMPGEDALMHVSVSFMGARDGEILWLGITAGYRTEKVRVVYLSEPLGRREEKPLVYNSEAWLQFDAVIPAGVQVSSGEGSASGADGSLSVSVRSVTERYIAEDILYTRDGNHYSVKLTSFSGEEALDRAEAAVKQRIE